MTQAYLSLKHRALERQRLLESKPRVRVGTAMCGLVVGAGDVVEAFRRELEAQRIDATVSEVGCLGLCYAEPLVDIQTSVGSRVLYHNVTSDQVSDLVQSDLVAGTPVLDRALATLGGGAPLGVPDLNDLPMMRGQRRIVLRNAGHIDPEDLEEYIAVGGYAALDKALSEMTSQEVQQQVALSGLRGRGRMEFPTGAKWRSLIGSPGPVKYILCNCEEGGPGGFSDKGILASDPHTVIEGMILSGYATGASNGVVFIRHGHEGPIGRTKEALRQAYGAGLLGKNVLGTDFSFDAEVSLVGESYVSGEETAVMEAVEGKRAMPRCCPPFPIAMGLWGKPSSIDNVKTLSYVPEIIAQGGEWFASIGTERSKGTAILCLSGSIQRPGMVEVPMGMNLRQVVEGLGGGVSNGKRLKLVQTGGPLGGMVNSDMLDISLDFDVMAQAGAALGSGSIIVADESTCTVDLTRLLVAFCQYESCGKCFPCRLGTEHLLEILERICRFEGRPDDLELMRQVGMNMTAGSLCGHGQLGFNPMESALNYFAGEFRTHVEERRCPAGVCTGVYLTPQRYRR
ncbi:NADH-ubiquinone oxidoreductase-F iron-sulfur binding region domain-containing protein [Chloroflexota bacterium]